MRLSICLHEFFDTYLPHLKGVSSHTIKTYRDTFTLFLPFAAHYHSTPVDSLTIQDLSMNLILEFFDHLEGNRHNTPRTRNLRLATFKSLAKMIRLMYPEHKEWAERIYIFLKKGLKSALSDT